MTAVEPDPDTSTESAEATCATCGVPVETDEWHPAATTTTDDGTVEIRSFCGRSCRDRWRERRE
ncbi:DUF7576 family protein [Haloarchaeobius iranensis]|uniref:Small CPxCG-related zinc finger protein n=1 Tax=Haloarchaeobius iranensis TaxID=996166 RepID=A0A1G9X1W0_9EURY|nr:hypothetical protein [Haloarchaeobius iranensis]SDM90744.1 hypothetical protein SAMN05192554_109109 [Haloarchaeobius iranensis]